MDACNRDGFNFLQDQARHIFTPFPLRNKNRAIQNIPPRKTHFDLKCDLITLSVQVEQPLMPACLDYAFSLISVILSLFCVPSNSWCVCVIFLPLPDITHYRLLRNKTGCLRALWPLPIAQKKGINGAKKVVSPRAWQGI